MYPYDSYGMHQGGFMPGPSIGAATGTDDQQKKQQQQYAGSMSLAPAYHSQPVAGLPPAQPFHPQPSGGGAAPAPAPQPNGMAQGMQQLSQGVQQGMKNYGQLQKGVNPFTGQPYTGTSNPFDKTGQSGQLGLLGDPAPQPADPTLAQGAQPLPQTPDMSGMATGMAQPPIDPNMLNPFSSFGGFGGFGGLW